MVVTVAKVGSKETRARGRGQGDVVGPSNRLHYRLRQDRVFLPDNDAAVDSRQLSVRLSREVNARSTFQGRASQPLFASPFALLCFSPALLFSPRP